MATKAKLSLSQLLFRRTNSSSSNNTGYVNGSGGGGGTTNGNNSNNNNNNNNGLAKTEQCGGGSAGGGDSCPISNIYSSRKQSSANFGTVSSGRSGFYEFASPPEIVKVKGDHNPQGQQLHGILKKPNKNDGDMSSSGKNTKSSLHRSRSNPNPSNNPLKEVSWSCPTLEKRREVILNYFERIILENKQEQNGKMRTKPNIPCESTTAGLDRESSEPIYEEISDCRGYNNYTSADKTGSLKPKVMPKKVRMNIPQDHHYKSSNGSGGSPIYDKLCRSHSMSEPFSNYDTASSSSSTSSTSSSQGFYENFRPEHEPFGSKPLRASRSHSFHDNFRSSSTSNNNNSGNSTGSYNIQLDPDTDQLYAKVCKRKKIKGNEQRQPSTSAYNNVDRDDEDDLRVQVSCANVVTMIPVIMPCSSSFSASCLSLSSSSDNNNDDTTARGNNGYAAHRHVDDNEEQYTEKILPDKDIAYVKCDNRGSSRSNKNNLSVIHLLATYDPTKEIEEFIPTPSFTAIIDSTECAPKSISVPVRADINNNNKSNNNVDSRSSHSPATPLVVANCSFTSYDDHDVGVMVSDKRGTVLSTSDDEDDVEGKYEFRVKKSKVGQSGGVSITQVDHDITKELLLLTSESEDEDICETKSILKMDTDVLHDPNDGLSNGKYITIEDDDRGFDSFLDENDSGLERGDNAFKAENFRNQRTFAQLQQDVPPDALKKKAASVLDLINSEISDLHMRELELKKFHGSGESPKSNKDESDGNHHNTEEFEGNSSEDDFSDSAIEYDGFTTNGSNSSGQVSPSENLKEITTQDEPDLVQPTSVQDELRPSEVKVRPLIEEEDKTIKFSVTEETPIEREIRLTREREEEFRRLNNLPIQSSTTAVSPTSSEVTRHKNDNVGTTPTLAKIVNSVSRRPENQDKPAVQNEGPKDVQYEMATARFKREIEENMKREKELFLEGRLKKTEENNEEPPVTNQDSQNETKTEETPPPVQTVQEMPRKPVLAKIPPVVAKLPAARFFSPPAYNGNKPNRITPVVSPIISRGAFAYPTQTGGDGSQGGRVTVGGSLPVGIGRPSYTSMEKYILQSSYNYMNPGTPKPEDQLFKGFESMKPTHYAIPEDPLRIIQKANSSDDENSEDKEVEEKPKRRYIPAQDKIHQEIQELAMREKELTRTRAKWKSTLDLPEGMNDDSGIETTAHSTLSLNISSSSSGNEDQDKLVKDNDVVEKQQAEETKQDDDDETNQILKIKAPPRRRHSVLINQWEERIRQQQQLINKK